MPVTIEEFLAAIKALGLTRTRYGNAWETRDGTFVHVPDPYKIKFEDRPSILKDVQRSVTLPQRCAPDDA
jgi:hypothetical protein